MDDNFEKDVIDSLAGGNMEPKYKKLNTDNSGEIFKFEKEGDAVEGIFQGYQDVTTKMGQSKLYVITSKKGDVKIWGNRLLDSNLIKVDIGQQIRITFLGKAKGKSGFFYNNFSIEVAE